MSDVDNPAALREHLGQRARRRVPEALIATVGVSLGVYAELAIADWGVINWINLLYGIFLSVGLTLVGRRQQRLREAMANLELREKVGVIEAHALRAEGETSDPLWCLYVASDARAALHLFPLANPPEQADLLIAIERAFRAMKGAGLVAQLSDSARVCVRQGSSALAVALPRTASMEHPSGRAALEAVDDFVRVLRARDDESAR